MSFFAKPNYLVYDEWFDNNLEKTKFDDKKKKIKNISKIHEFFYEQSTHKVGGSENNLKFNEKVSEKKIIKDAYLKSNLEKHNSLSQKKFSFFKNFPNKKFEFSIKKFVYSLSIFTFLVIFGFGIFFHSSSKKSDSNIKYMFVNTEKEF